MENLLKEKTVKIFYSWQTDIRKNKNTILNGINKAKENLQKDRINLLIEQSTSNLTGSPDITTAIYNKINQCDFFIGDVSIIYNNKSKGTCNSNVMVELGYAISQMGKDRIISLFNINTGQPNLLPFDIRNNRFTQFKNDVTGSTKYVDLIAEIIEYTILNFERDQLNLIKKLKKADYMLFDEISRLVSEFDQKRKSSYGCIYDQYSVSYTNSDGTWHRGDFEWSFELQALLMDITKRFSNEQLNDMKQSMLNKLQTAQADLSIETNYYNEANRYEAWSKYYLLAEHSELAKSKFGFTGSPMEIEQYKKRIDDVIAKFDVFIGDYKALQKRFLELSE